jgi:tRNA1(Val) A37 N6-methylase TrmN6
VADGGSEDAETYKNIPMVDCVLSCPPYFDLEIYSEDRKQSVVKYVSYNNWVNQYWNDTVKNCLKILDQNGYFVLIIKDVVGKHNIGEDMIDICLKHKIKLIEKIYYKTSVNHLSGKVKTGKKSKNNEMVCVFQKL